MYVYNTVSDFFFEFFFNIAPNFEMMGTDD